MTRELKVLGPSIVLGLVQILRASHAASRQRGYVWTASSRDEVVPALTGMAGRLARAQQIFVETFPLFATGVLIAHVAATHSWMTEWGVQLYFWGRVAYLALYAAGVFVALPCMERGGARDWLGSAVAGLSHSSMIAARATCSPPGLASVGASH